MRHRAIAVGVCAAFVALLLAGVAQARNANCAGGIQYVVQAMKDKERGNLEDYQREMGKAVDRLGLCASEDPEDLEALAYLGWAYAEVDSFSAAGEAFRKAIEGMKAKGDKKATWAEQNRESYWAKNFNEGVAKIQAGQAAWPDFFQQPQNDAEKTLKADATARYEQAIRALKGASQLKPEDSRTIRNLGTVYVYLGDFSAAEKVFRDGLQTAPGDSDLVSSLKMVRANVAGRLIDEKKYDEALAYYGDLLRAEPKNADLHLGVADAYFKRAAGQEGDAKKADFRKAGEEYGAAADLKPGEADLLFNSALSYHNGGDYVAAERQWRSYLKLKPDDTPAMSALGSALAEQGRFDDAIQALHQAVNLKPKDKTLHRQLGGVYARANVQDHSYEEMVVYIALERGTVAASVEETAKKGAPAGSEAAKTLASMGSPDEIREWDAEGQKYQTWFYWTKNVAFTFNAGKLAAKSDWGAPPPAPAPPVAPKSTGAKKR